MICSKHPIHYRIQPNLPIKCLTCEPPPRPPMEVGIVSSSGRLISGLAIKQSISLFHVRAAERVAWRAAEHWGAGPEEWELVAYEPAELDDEGWPENSRISED